MCGDRQPTAGPRPVATLENAHRDDAWLGYSAGQPQPRKPPEKADAAATFAAAVVVVAAAAAA